MKTKLLMIEGIPGSGKSTMAKLASEELTRLGVRNHLYQEGMVHPANLDSYAVLTQAELPLFKHAFSEYEEQIMAEIESFGEEYLIRKSLPWDTDGRVGEYLQPYSVWDQGIEKERFMDLQLRRWKQFVQSCQENQGTYIFECAFLQDQITELMMFYQSSKEELAEYFHQMERIIRPLNPYIIYLQQADIETTLRRVAKERVDEQGHPVWMEGISGFISQTPYGKANDLSGFEGLVSFYRRRKELDLAMIHAMSIPSQSIDNDDYQWQQVDDKVKAKMAELVKEC